MLHLASRVTCLTQMDVISWLVALFWGRSGIVVSALDFRSEGRSFEAKSLPSCCFLRQETVPQFVYLGSTFSHLQPIKRTHSIAGLKMTFIECSLSLALYMRPQINLTIYKENFFNPSTTVESQKVNPSILLTLMSANSVCTFRG